MSCRLELSPVGHYLVSCRSCRLPRFPPHERDKDISVRAHGGLSSGSVPRKNAAISLRTASGHSR